MQNKCMTILLLVLLVPMLTIAQNKKVVQVKKSVVTEQSVTSAPGTQNKSVTTKSIGKFDPSVGEEIGLTTNYDVFSNSIIKDQITFYNGTVYFANMVRPFESNPVTQRHVVFTTRDAAGTYTHKSVTGGQAGWPSIDVQRTGTTEQQGTIGIVFHTPNKLAIWDATTSSFIISAAIEPNVTGSTDPTMQFLGDNIFIGTSRGRTGYDMYKTADYGVTFTLFDSIQAFRPGIFSIDPMGTTDFGMSKSFDETRLAYYATNTGAGAVGETTADSADNAFIILSTDAGATFTGKTIGRDGETSDITGYPEADFAAFFENFGQLDVALGNDGIQHAVANGYGAIMTDTSAHPYRFPVLYWNSTTNKWKAISNHTIDMISDTIMADKRPGNGIGQSWPSMAISPDGKVIFVAWQGPEMNGSEVNVSAANNVMWTDIYYAYSTDGGNTFTAAATLPGANVANVGEGVPSLCEHLEVVGDKLRAHMVYLKDLDAGSNVNGEGVATLNPIMYRTFDITAPTAVNDNNVINSFALNQNYPNPFNPTTSISFSIAERSNVSLKVFDVLGKEVANLVSGEKESGHYTVNFNASNLASGLYVYTLKAGSNTMSKKMMLMK